MTTFNGVASVPTTGSVLLATSDTAGLLLVQNTDATNPIFVGTTSGVTSSTGFKVAQGTTVTLPLGQQGPASVYAIATGGAVVTNFWFGDNGE